MPLRGKGRVLSGGGRQRRRVELVNKIKLFHIIDKKSGKTLDRKGRIVYNKITILKGEVNMYYPYLPAMFTVLQKRDSVGGTMFYLLVCGVMLLAQWFLFEKAGEPGWQCIVPFYNIYKLFDIVYGSGWKCFLLLVPGLNIVLGILFCFRLAQAYGKGILHGFILLFAAPIGILMLAFGSARYCGPVYKFI